MLVRIKRKLNEEPLDSVVLGRQTNPKRANVADLRHALQDTSLNPQVFRLLTTAADAVSLPPNILDTIARRKKEWGARPRRLSPRKTVKSSFEQATSMKEGLMEGQLQQSKSQRQARVWNCRRVKVQGFSVLEFSGDDRAKEPVAPKPLEPWLKRNPPGKDVVTVDRLRDIEQEAKMRGRDAVATTATTKTIRRAKGWREWQQQHRASDPIPSQIQQSPEVSLPQHYADLLKEYYGEDSESLAPLNVIVSPHISSSSHSSFTSSSTSSSSCSSLTTISDAPMFSSDFTPTMSPSSNFDTCTSERDYVWDLYYCCGSEMEPDPNAVELTYESEASEAESEDSNAKEHDYTDEEEGDSSSEDTDEENSDGGVMNKRMTRSTNDSSDDHVEDGDD